MLYVLLFVSTAWPCAALITDDLGAIATSDAQEVILEYTDQGARTRFRVSYDGDAASFGWLIVVHGSVGEGDVTEADEAAFDTFRQQSQPQVVTYSVEGGEESSGGCRGLGTRNDVAMSGGDAWDGETRMAGVEVTAEGFAGPYAYQVLSADDGAGLTSWLDERGFDLGATETTLDEYIAEGGYSFVVITLTPDQSDTPQEGRTLPALSVQSDSDQLQFPARMAQTGMAEELRTTVWVIGDLNAEISAGWASRSLESLNSQDADAAGAYDTALREAASENTPTYLSPFSGDIEGLWVTRFDTLAPKSVHTMDPVFGFTDWQIPYQLEIVVPSGSTDSIAWLFLPLFGVGLARRRRRF
jgi:hypothetical protein